MTVTCGALTDIVSVYVALTSSFFYVTELRLTDTVGGGVGTRSFKWCLLIFKQLVTLDASGICIVAPVAGSLALSIVVT